MRKITLGLAVLGLAVSTAALASGAMPVVEEQYATSGALIGVDVGYAFLGTPERNLYDVPESWLEQSFIYNAANHHDDVQVFLDEGHSIGEFAWGAFLGYDFAISPRAVFGAEIGYKDLGRSKYDSKLTVQFDAPRNSRDQIFIVDDWHHKVTQQAVDFLLTGHYYVYQGVNVFAKAGVAYVGSKSTWDNNFVVFERDYDRRNDSGSYKDETIVDKSWCNSKTIWRLRPEVALGIGYSFTRNFDLHVMYDYIHGSNNDHGTAFLPWSPAKIYSSNMVSVGATWKF